MKIKTFIFLFLVLIMLLSVSAQKPNDNVDGGGDNGPEVPPETSQSPPQEEKPTETTSSTPPAKETNPPKQVDQTTKAPATTQNIQTTKQPVTTKIQRQTTAAPPASSVPAALPTNTTPQDNGTPVPEIHGDAENVNQKGKSSISWGKIGMIGGGIIGALFVIGIVFNFINKRKSSSDNMDINFVVDNQAPEPEMSTSMFNQPQNDMYNQPQNQGYQDYDMQYGQYGADNQYNQPDPYGQGYAQDVNFAQRTLSLNRNPSANAQNYQIDENAREVIYNHRPEAGDEIELRRGDQATIYEKYEDGWAWGYNITTGKTGMFPQQCLA